MRCVAWESGGRCLAATSQGLAFWNGTEWLPAKGARVPDPDCIRFVRRLAPGLWLIGGDGAFLAVYGTDGVTEVLSSSDSAVSFTDADGDLADLAVLVGAQEGLAPSLFAVCGRRWLRPASLGEVASISGISRMSDEAWLVAGRAPAGGFIARYEPLMWNVTRLAAPECRAYLATAARAEIGVAVAVGTQGRTIRIASDGPVVATIPGEPDLSAVAVDPGGGAWAASSGQLWLQRAQKTTSWNPVWHDASWETVPIVSVYADVGVVTAMTVDGGIVEGHLHMARSGDSEDTATMSDHD